MKLFDTITGVAKEYKAIRATRDTKAETSAAWLHVWTFISGGLYLVAFIAVMRFARLLIGVLLMKAAQRLRWTDMPALMILSITT